MGAILSRMSTSGAKFGQVPAGLAQGHALVCSGFGGRCPHAGRQAANAPAGPDAQAARGFDRGTTDE